MQSPTTDQRAVLDSVARIRLVRAAPGGGKTWLVAAAIRNELEGWTSPTAGIAALSFTRVGGDEIRHALGHDLDHPHFVGTLDAFVFRYVVRPHLRAVFREYRAPTLVPGEWEPDKNWRRTDISSAEDPRIQINPFACVWIGRAKSEDHTPILARPVPNSGKYKALGVRDRAAVISAKEALWRSRGLVTHSDAAYLATEILRHAEWGTLIRDEIVRRFPLLVVDELQDTGHFLGETVFRLLRASSVRGLLVGDPDQAIYEFTGAKPQLFHAFAKLGGAAGLELASSRRCPRAVAAVASQLKGSDGPLEPAEHGPGRAFLVHYVSPREIGKVVSAVRAAHPRGVVRVITRSNATVRLLTGLTGSEPVSLGCRPATALHRGVQAFRRGRAIAALAAARTAVELAMLDRDGVGDEELRAAGIDPAHWKELTVRCLMGAHALATDGTVFDWHVGAHAVLEHEFGLFGRATGHYPTQAIRKPQQRGAFAAAIRTSLPEPGEEVSSVEGVPVQTVHAVKGETHDATIFVCPPTPGKGGARKCPSTLWWSADEADAEERRVAYVAVTRSRGSLVLCVDEASFTRLSDTRPEFLATFECVTPDELRDTLART
jgi:DNA helicase-2/ATP-dependent DNA helicase PcrA